VTSLRTMMGGRSTPRSSTLIPPVLFRFEERLHCLAVVARRPTRREETGNRRQTPSAEMGSLWGDAPLTRCFSSS
jgi:hypothetical protein